ncbi:MAG TPA: EAL domain-containing protein [Geopsychrobacteraceae bacterium]|nr:EAL domain-containing protein [Geopsychrobacteraceae bacterium]
MPRPNLIVTTILLAVTMGLMLPAYNIYVLRPALFNALTEDTEKDAIRSATHIAIMAFPDRQVPLQSKLEPQTVNLLNQLIYNFSFEKLKVFNLDGMILYSSDGKDIGNYNTKRYFQQNLLKEAAHTRLVKKGGLTTEKQTAQTDVVETYVPIRPSGSIIGVFEIYHDITASRNSLVKKIRQSSLFVGIGSIAFILLFLLLGLRARRSLTQHKIAEKKIKKLAYYDILTDLPNSTLFLDRLDQALHRCERDGLIAALLYLDLDHFKEINDTLGHQQGDVLLQKVGKRLEECLRKTDTLARMGGDEFAILLASIATETDASVVAEMILEKMRPPFHLDGHEAFITPSIGIALYPANSASAEILRKNADIAMYAAKEQGRASYSFFSDEMNHKIMENHDLERGLRRALYQREFHLVYQPQFDLQTEHLVGSEALLRWTDPDKGLIPPDKFIPVAEKTGLIGPIGEWVLRSACLQNKKWQQEGYPELRIAVNLSAYQFQKTDLADTVDLILKETGMSPNCLELELTESMLMENAETNILTLTDLKVRNILLSIDDFGTGYSSLSYLKNFPVDRIKIDQTFIGQICSQKSDASIIKAIIAMAQSLQLKVVAEGVETIEQLAFLKANGCDEVQGYYLGRPMSPGTFLTFMKDKHTPS